MDNILRRLDLNLLVTLDALLAEHNVTRAAQKLHLAQPTVSLQLARLRDVFSDPLLLPGPRGMRPTARADALREPLRLALESLAHAVSPARAFDPATARHTWRAAASDYAESTILLPALEALRRAAPHARLAIVELAPARLARQAEEGIVDLAFHIRQSAPPGLRQKLLFEERYVLAGRAGHPRLKRRPTRAQFCKLDHVVVSPEGGGFQGPTDAALARLDLQRPRRPVGAALSVSRGRAGAHRSGRHGAGTAGARQSRAMRGGRAGGGARLSNAHALARARAPGSGAPVAARSHRASLRVP